MLSADVCDCSAKNSSKALEIIAHEIAHVSKTAYWKVRIYDTFTEH